MVLIPFLAPDFLNKLSIVVLLFFLRPAKIIDKLVFAQVADHLSLSDVLKENIYEFLQLF